MLELPLLGDPFPRCLHVSSPVLGLPIPMNNSGFKNSSFYGALCHWFRLWLSNSGSDQFGTIWNKSCLIHVIIRLIFKNTFHVSCQCFSLQSYYGPFLPLFPYHHGQSPMYISVCVSISNWGGQNWAPYSRYSLIKAESIRALVLSIEDTKNL